VPCWLALLLVRIVKTTTGTPGPPGAASGNACTWAPSPGPVGLSRQRTELTAPPT